MHEHKADFLPENERRFLAEVQERMANGDERLATDPALPGKLMQAYREAKTIGVTQEDLLADFLYLGIQSPGFHRHPAIQAWLHQPGATPDLRFADLIAAVLTQSRKLMEAK